MKPLAICLLLLCGCARFPELDATVNASAENADFPTLVPIERIVAAPEPASENVIDPNADVAARVARLRARAARLRGHVVDSGTRNRMRTGVQQP